jgi:hypothetical protein
MSDYMRQRMQHILNGRPLKKSTPHPIAKKSDKRKEKEKAMMNDDTMVVWFEDRRKEMKGTCAHCGGKSCTDDKFFKHSIAHILPKALFNSVAHHPSNWIELCFFGNSCHTNMDNGLLDMTEMNCWDAIVERFQEMYPYIDQKERKKIPETLKQYIEIDG